MSKCPNLCAGSEPECEEDVYKRQRLDLALGEKNVLTTRYQYVNNSTTNAGIGNLTLPGTGNNNTSLSNELQMSDTQTYSCLLYTSRCV